MKQRPSDRTYVWSQDDLARALLATQPGSLQPSEVERFSVYSVANGVILELWLRPEARPSPLIESLKAQEIDPKDYVPSAHMRNSSVGIGEPVGIDASTDEPAPEIDPPNLEAMNRGRAAVGMSPLSSEDFPDAYLERRERGLEKDRKGSDPEVEEAEEPTALYHLLNMVLPYDLVPHLRQIRTWSPDELLQVSQWVRAERRTPGRTPNAPPSCLGVAIEERKAENERLEAQPVPPAKTRKKRAPRA